MARYTQEQLITAYRNAPVSIQDTLDGGLVEKVVSDVQVRCRLHADVASTLDDETRFLLLGLVNPAEFFGSLMLAGTDEQTARSIMEEINNRIFIPLKQQVSGSTAKAPAPISYSETPVRVPTPTPVAPPPALDYAPTPVTQILPGSFAAVPAPVQHMAPEVPAPAVETPPVVASHTMVSDMASIQQTQVAPPAIAPPAPSQPLPSQPPIIKSYGSDPYREPI